MFALQWNFPILSFLFLHPPNCYHFITVYYARALYEKDSLFNFAERINNNKFWLKRVTRRGKYVIFWHGKIIKFHSQWIAFNLDVWPKFNWT